MKASIALAVGVSVLLASGAALAQEPQLQAPELANNVCMSCHGPEGRSVSPVFPRLAGQQKAYIKAQLEAFRNHTRADPLAQAYMWGIASQLSDSGIDELASYYSAQQPVAGTAGDPALMAAGKKIYTDGIPAEQVPACSSCHGVNAQGVGAFPRLGGQHPEYLLAQLDRFKSGERANAPIMLGVVHNMTADQFKAVAAYAASK
ncbi:cytochrome c-552 precursor [mine drainage metagenome]|uniref:Cytochrome c-552 n=1 Tax=mine drainage metagenome TaxID=410659 RepID=A0A1J5RRP8_9ZZZZ